jgi:hypothetical protein
MAVKRFGLEQGDSDNAEDAEVAEKRSAEKKKGGSFGAALSLSEDFF